MDTQSLQTASVYLNNLLLSRGLLRNGKAIDFAQPEKGSSGTDATMAKVINLVHDLVLRRDREADQRENLATTIRGLRSTETRQGLEIERLQTKTTDLTRSLSLAEGKERAFKSTLRNAEASARTLREQMLRMKLTLRQVRTQCANDVRKRDVQLQRMKTHITGVQRGKREGLGVSTITITPTPTASSSTRFAEGGDGIDSPDYTLKQETTEFLTGLCQQLSDENDALIGLSRNAIATLKTLQGLPSNVTVASEGDENGRSGSIGVSGLSPDQGLVTAAPISYDALSAEMDSILDHLRTLLTNPSFVPIEEVEIREDEIIRLREGWVMMEGRLREAVGMMNGWKRRMIDGGDSVDLDGLKIGLGLGMSVAKQTEDKDELELAESSSLFDEDEKVEDEDDAAAEGSSLDNPASSVEADPLLVRGQRALGETSGNVRPSASPRKVSFQAVPEEDTTSLSKEDVDPDEVVLMTASPTKQTAQKISSDKVKSKIPRQASHNMNIAHQYLLTSSSQVSRALQSPMTISQKLAAIEAEALVAGQTRKAEEATITHKRNPSKTVGKSRSSRRRSTLSPQELEHLMGMSA